MISDYETYVDLVRYQFKKITANDSTYDGVKLYVSSEQQFEKYKDRESNAIYVVLKFYSATLNFGQSLLPFTITGLSEKNKLDIAKQLFLTYAETYNLAEEDNVVQIYQAPSVESNFNEVYDGFRSVILMYSTLVIGEDINNVTITYNQDANTSLEIDYISQIPTFNNTLDTQPYTNNNNNTSSIGKYSTFTLQITTYFQNNIFTQKILNILARANNETPNSTINMTIDFGYLSITKDLKLVTATFPKDIGNLPYLSVTLTE